MSERELPSRLITQKAVMKLVGIGSRETLDRWVRRGLFPLPIRVGGGRLRWVLAEVEAWIEARKTDRASNVSLAKGQGRSFSERREGQHHV
jgi:predicted DNA-binding transcriptional regulator AlpA